MITIASNTELANSAVKAVPTPLKNADIIIPNASGVAGDGVSVQLYGLPGRNCSVHSTCPELG